MGVAYKVTHAITRAEHVLYTTLVNCNEFEAPVDANKLVTRKTKLSASTGDIVESGEPPKKSKNALSRGEVVTESERDSQSLSFTETTWDDTLTKK